MQEPANSPGTELERLEAKLSVLEGKVDAAYQSSERVRTYLLWGFWLTVAAIAVPLLLLPLFVPAFLASQGVGGLGF